MNYTYNVEQPLETYYSKTACSLQTDPDLYALRNKTKQNLANVIKKQQQQQQQQQQQYHHHQQQQLVSTSNRLAYVEALVGKYQSMNIHTMLTHS
jgi:Fe2+ transport system protein B